MCICNFPYPISIKSPSNHASIGGVFRYSIRAYAHISTSPQVITSSLMIEIKKNNEGGDSRNA